MKVVLRNVKSIRQLEFDLPSTGVWLVTGLNGSGKTSLFAALYRIGAQHAFQKYYRTSPLERRMDSYSDAEIEYSVDGEVVSYHYGGQRWRATPRRNAALLSQTPYSTVEFIEANGERIEPFADEIQARRLQDASDEIRSFMQHVLGDDKWATLKYVNTQRGRGNDAFIIPYQVRNRTYYFSEKNFSLGELCILKLAKKIQSVDDNSLVLIDEVEMALHPQAQVRLLQKVSEIAVEKQLTVLFSTHSATLIKNAPRKNLILLKALGDGTVTSTRSVFPAQVLGEIAFDDELTADFILYVEDKQAKLLLEQLVALYMAHTRPDAGHRPLYKIVPVGGFVQVIEMLNSSHGIFPGYVKRFALLDKDVETEALADARRSNNQQILELFRHAAGNVSYLPCTPELGLVELLETHARGDAGLMHKINHAFDGQVVNASRILSSADYRQINSENPRTSAKSKVAHFAQKVSASTNLDDIQVRRILYGIYADYNYAQAMGPLCQILGPILNSR